MKFKGKFLNFRYLPFMLLAGIAGILLVSLLDFSYSIVVVALFSFAIILCLCKRNLRKYAIRLVVLAITFTVFFLIGGEIVSKAKQLQTPINDATIMGTINSDSDILEEDLSSNDRLYYLVLTNCTYTAKNQGGNLDGTVGTYVYLSSNITFEVGDTIVLNCDIIPKTVKLNESVNIYNYIEGIRWTLDNAKYKSIIQAEANVFEKIKVRAREAVTKYVPAGGILFSMVFGDKKVMSVQFKAATKLVGLAHLFAVSGLHLGFVSALVGFVCKKCKANKIVDYFVVMLVSGLYAFLVGFGPSVMRAFLMLAIFKLGNLLGVRHCGASSLCLSALIILLINPFTLFNISFQLSLMSIAGILLFKRTFDKIFKTKFKTLGEFMSINLSVNIALLPLLLHYFGRVSLTFAVSNLLILPFVSLAFPIIFVFVLLSAAIPQIAYLLVPLGIVFSVLEKLVIFLANISLLTINKSLSTFWVLVYIATLVVMSSYSLIAKKFKCILAVILCTIICLNVLLTSFGRIDGSVQLETIINKNDTSIVMFDSKDEHYLIVSGKLTIYTLSACSSFMAENNIDKIDGIVKANISNSEIDALYKYKTALNIKSLVTSKNYDNIDYIFGTDIYFAKTTGDYLIAPLNENIVQISSQKSNIVFVENNNSDMLAMPNDIDLMYCVGNFDIVKAANPKYFVNNIGVINNIPQSIRSDFTFIIKSAKIKIEY